MGKKKIMIVDDEEDTLDLIENLLESDFDVIKANDGKKCLSLLKKDTPDLILVDIMMPKMSGTDLAEAIRSDPKTRKMKIAFLTVVGLDDVDKKRVDKIKAVDYILKPFENKVFVEKMKKIMAK